MKTYYIYHVPGFKIGCTSNLNKRLKDQNLTKWELLETHTDGWLAGDREKELQKEYGLPIDAVHYMISVQNRYKLTNEDRSKGGRNSIDQMRSFLTRDILSKAGKAGLGKSKPKTLCIHCNRMIANNMINRFHNDNCKQK